jgi:hypothetical protein
VLSLATRAIGESSSVIIERLLTNTREDLLTVDRNVPRGRGPATLPATGCWCTATELPPARRTASRRSWPAGSSVTLATQCFTRREDPGPHQRAAHRAARHLLNWSTGRRRWTWPAAGRLLQPAATEDMTREMEDLSSPIKRVSSATALRDGRHAIRCAAKCSTRRGANGCDAERPEARSHARYSGRESARPREPVSASSGPPRTTTASHESLFYQGVDLCSSPP